jgi:hypothetical protein
MTDLPPLTPEMIERAARLPRELRSQCWRRLWHCEFRLAIACYRSARLCENLLAKIRKLEEAAQ